MPRSSQTQPEHEPESILYLLTAGLHDIVEISTGSAPWLDERPPPDEMRTMVAAGYYLFAQVNAGGDWRGSWCVVHETADALGVEPAELQRRVREFLDTDAQLRAANKEEEANQRIDAAATIAAGATDSKNHPLGAWVPADDYSWVAQNRQLDELADAMRNVGEDPVTAAHAAVVVITLDRDLREHPDDSAADVYEAIERAIEDFKAKTLS